MPNFICGAASDADPRVLYDRPARNMTAKDESTREEGRQERATSKKQWTGSWMFRSIAAMGGGWARHTALTFPKLPSVSPHAPRPQRITGAGLPMPPYDLGMAENPPGC